MSSAKSQPLHNFTLPPLLRWKKDGKPGGSHKRRRSTKSPSQHAASASPPRDYVSPTSSPLQEYPAPPSPESPRIGGDLVDQAEGMKQLAVGGDSEKLYFLREETLRYYRGGDCSPESEAWRNGKGAAIEHHKNQYKKSAFGVVTKGVCSEGKLERKCKAREGDIGGIKKNPNVVSVNGVEEKVRNSDEEIQLWNLRPRNVKSKAKVGGEKGDVSVSGKNKGLPQIQLRRSSGKDEKEKKCGKPEDKEKAEKKKLSISITLAKEEIEDDIFALTGSKPWRRPKRRPKNVQKQLDMAFPGLWLVSITPESYKVSESSLKG